MKGLQVNKVNSFFFYSLCFYIFRDNLKHTGTEILFNSIITEFENVIVIILFLYLILRYFKKCSWKTGSDLYLMCTVCNTWIVRGGLLVVGVGSFHGRETAKWDCFWNVYIPLSVLLLATIGAKLIGPHGGLQVDKRNIIDVTRSVNSP